MRFTSYEGGVLYAPAPDDASNYFRQLLDEQVRLKTANAQKREVDKEAERFKMRVAQQKLEDEKFDHKKAEAARAHTELQRFMSQSLMYQPDRNGRRA